MTTSPPTTPKPKRRWLQFGVKSMLVATLLACFGFAWMAYLSRSGRQQRAAAFALRKSGASVQYDRRLDSDSQFLTSASEGPIGAFADMFAPNVDDVFAEDKPLTDADLVNLRGLHRLNRLVLSGTKITDSGLVHLGHVPQLSILWLSRTKITDAGLMHLKAVPELEVLLLDGTLLTDAGLAHLRPLRRLWVLDLSNTKIRGSGLVHLQALRKLQCLDLAQTPLSDAGLTHLKPLEHLEDLDLNNTEITGKGLAELRNLQGLTRLYLNDTKLSDAGVAHLRAFPSLIVLNMENTPASDAAVDALRAARPDLSIDGHSYRNLHEDSQLYERWGVRDAAAPNYLLSEWIQPGRDKPTKTALSLRLEAALKNDRREVMDVRDIHITEPMRLQLSRLRRVQWLRLSTETTAHDVSWIGTLTQLRGLSLRGANLKGADFRTFAALQSLQWLDLGWVDMSASDFATLPRLASLQTLFLAGEEVNDQHLLHLAQLRLPALATLSLQATSVSDVAVAPFCARYNLDCFNLSLSRNVTEQSVSALGRMTKLRKLGIGGTGLSPNFGKTPAVERLCTLLPKCSVDYGD